MIFLQKITEEKYDVSISSFGDGLLVQRQTEPCVTCTISLTSPTVKDDLPAAGKSCSCKLWAKTTLEKVKRVLHFSMRSVMLFHEIYVLDVEQLPSSKLGFFVTKTL